MGSGAVTRSQINDSSLIAREAPLWRQPRLSSWEVSALGTEGAASSPLSNTIFPVTAEVDGCSCRTLPYDAERSVGILSFVALFCSAVSCLRGSKGPLANGTAVPSGFASDIRHERAT